MANNDIAQKLALLPEGLAEDNLQTWQRAMRYFQDRVSDYPGSRLKYLLGLVESISKLEEAKLFRVKPSARLLVISATTKEDQDHGDFFIVVGLKDEDTTNIVCSRPTEIAYSVVCKNNEIVSTLQPLLDRLWNETRGKHNA